MPVPDVQKIGKYEILAELGQGGYGRVYRAFDPTVGRPVAIKILTAESNRDLLTRFRNEATAAGNLRHRNIVTVYDYGEYNGRPYLVMELLEGEDLTHVIANRTPLSLLQKMNIMDQIAAGLDCAHQNGVLHRDVKPANIRILPDGTVKIMDFGIARVNADGNATRLTQQGDLIGTILYMSPEQFAGGEADALCDIFAYGLIYFELLTGKHPFRSSDPRAVMFKITMEDPEPVRALVPDCPEGLERILNRALHKDRELRYQNLRDLQLDAEPLMFELKQARAASLVTDATELRTARDWQKALLLINEALNLDPSNRDARQLREIVQGQIQREALQPRIDTLLQAARKQVAERLFTQAVQSLESALKLDRTNQLALASLESVREEMKSAQEAAVPAAAALAHVARKEWVEASSKSLEAARIDPRNPAVIRVREEIERHVSSVLAGVDLQIEDDALLEPAIRELSDLAVLRPESREIERKLAAAKVRLEGIQRAAKEARERALLVEWTVREATRGRDENRFEEALGVVEQGSKKYPDEQAFLNLKAELREKLELQRHRAAVDKAAVEARQRVENQDFSGAIRLLEDALALWPQENSLKDLLRNTRDAEQEWQRSQQRARVIREALEEGGELLDQGRPAQAAEVLRQASNEFPDARELQNLLQKAKEEQRRKGIEKALSEAKLKEQQQDFGGAIQIFETALKEWPEDKAVTNALQELRQAQQDWEHRQAIERVAAESQNLAGAHRHADALKVIQEGLQRYPDEPLLFDLQRSVQSQWEEEQRAEAVRRASEDSRAWIGQGRAEEAIRVLTSACGRYPAEEQLKQLLLDARQALERERHQGIDSAIGEAQVKAERQDFGGAIQILEIALRHWPDDNSLANALENVRQAQRDWERRQAIQHVAEESQDLARAHRHVDALKVVQEGLKEYPGEVLLVELQRSLQSQWEEEQRIDALQRASEDSRAWIEKGHAEEAIRVLGSACSKYPEEEKLKQLLLEARQALELERQQAIEKAVAGAKRKTEQQDFTGAIRLLESALQRCPEEVNLTNALENVQQAQQDWERRQAINRVVEESRGLAQAHRHQDALKVVEEGLKRHPGEPVLVELQLTLQTQWEEEQRTEGVRRASAEANALLERGQAEEAIRILTAACSTYPEEKSLKQLLLESHLALESQRRREAIAKAAADAFRLSEREDYTGALDILERALKSWPGEDTLTAQFRKTREAHASAERRRAISQVVQVAERLTGQNRSAEALDAIQAGLRTYSGEPELLAVEGKLKAQLELERRAAAVELAAKNGRQLLDEGRPGEAVEVLAKACGQFENEARLNQLLTRAQEALRTQQKREAIEKVAVEAQRRAERRDFAGAIETLTNGLKSWPKETRLSDLLKQTRKDREQWDRHEAIQAVARQAKKLADANRPADALKAVQAGLRKYVQDPSLIELQQQFQKQIAAPPRDAPPRAAPPKPAALSRTHLVSGGIGLGIAAVVAIGVFLRGGLSPAEKRVGLTIQSNIPGASISIGGQSCVLPNCTLKLAAGNYKLVAQKAGFGAVERTLSLKAGSGDVIVPLVFSALPQLIQVNTNFATGRVLLDGAPAGELRDGQFSLDRVSAGRHTIRVTGGDAEFEARWTGEPGAVPELTQPIAAKNVQATLLANSGENGTLACNCDVRTIKVDGNAVTPSVAEGPSLPLKNLKEGSRRITASDRSLLVDVKPNPSLNIFLSLDRNVGTLVVETGQDNATVFVNDRPYRRVTGHGLVRIPVDVGEYSVRVEKPGFRSPPAARVAVVKGEEKQVSLALTPLPASLEITGALPGALVKVDGSPAGETAANGTFRADVAAGDHEIELTKSDYGPVRFRARFTAGQPTRPRVDQVTMSRVVQPPARPEPKQPDPRQIEAQDWEKVRNSNSPDELDDFIRKHPGGAYIDTARTRISQLRQQIQADLARQAEQTAWDSLDKTRKAAVQDFLSRFGTGPHQQEARALIAELDKRDADALAATRAAAEQQRANEQKEKALLADQQSIVRMLSQFETAFNAKDLKGLQSLWRGMPKSVSDQFRYARTLTFQLRPVGTPSVNGDSATVICTRTLNMTTTDNQRVNSGNERVQVTLERLGSGWVISAVRTL